MSCALSDSDSYSLVSDPESDHEHVELLQPLQPRHGRSHASHDGGDSEVEGCYCHEYEAASDDSNDEGLVVLRPAVARRRHQVGGCAVPEACRCVLSHIGRMSKVHCFFHLR